MQIYLREALRDDCQIQLDATSASSVLERLNGLPLSFLAAV